MTINLQGPAVYRWHLLYLHNSTMVKEMQGGTVLVSGGLAG